MHFTGFLLVAIASSAVGSYIPHYEIHHHPQPYKFGYSVKDHHGEQHREESGDGHSVKGSYGFSDSRGIHRQVTYVADHGGFRAQVRTNEPGTANQNPAAVHVMSSAHNGQAGYGMSGMGVGMVRGNEQYTPVIAVAPLAVTRHAGQGYKYSAPLHGGHVSVYYSRHGYY